MAIFNVIWRLPTSWSPKVIFFLPKFFFLMTSVEEYIGEYMRNYAEENDLLKNTQRMFVSSFKKENDTIISPFLNFYLSLGLQCIKFIGLLSTRLGCALTTLFSLLLMLDEMETRIHYLKLWLRRWSFWVTARSVIKLWTYPNIR